MRREAFALAAGLALIALLAAPGVEAKATTLGPLPACEYITNTPGAYERIWTEGGVTHVRHQQWTSVVYAPPGNVEGGVFIGTNAGWSDFNLDANGNGNEFGSWNDGTFEGIVSGPWFNGFAHVTFVGHGPDNQRFYGTIVGGTDQCANGGNYITAFILMPHA